MIVAKDLRIPGLLGRNHISKFISNIDIEHLSLTLYEENWIAIPIYLTRSVTIPPGGVAYMDITADISDLPPKVLYLQFEIKTKLYNEFNPIIIPTFQIPLHDNIPYNSDLTLRILVHNSSTITYNFQQGSMIGVFNGITEEFENEKKSLILDSPDEVMELVDPENKSNLPPSIPVFPDIAYIENQISHNYFGEFIDYANTDIPNTRDAEAPSNITMININPNLESYQAAELDSLLKKYQQVFNSDQQYPPPADAPAMRIDTGDHAPIRQPNYRVNRKLWENVPAKIEQFLQKGIIRHSESSWCNPLNPIPKSNPQDPVRICVDFRKLNAITKKDSFPLPNIQDILEALRTPTYFGLIDLAAGYHQIPINEEDRQKTAFVANGQLFEWNVIIEGLANAPAWFQRYMVLYVLKGLIGKACYVYIDDIIVYGDTWEDYLSNLQLVLSRLQEFKISGKAAKTRLAYCEIKILGHIVGSGKLKPNPELIKAIVEFPNPQSIKQLQRFLGLANYYRKFIDKFSYIAQPLYELLRKENQRINDFTSIWKERQEAAMQVLKRILSSEPILKCPDHNRIFHLSTDACKLGIAAILSQPYDDGDHPIAYISRTLDKYEQKYAASELECLAIVWAVEQFRVYLGSNKFIIYTDHKPLAWLKTSISKNTRLHRWATLLSQYNFEIKHKPGKELIHVDCLSRAIESIETINESLKESMTTIKKILVPNHQRNYTNKETLIAYISSNVNAKGQSKWTTQYPNQQNTSHNYNEFCKCLPEIINTHSLNCKQCGQLMQETLISLPNQADALEPLLLPKPIIILTPQQLLHHPEYRFPFYAKYQQQCLHNNNFYSTGEQPSTYQCSRQLNTPTSRITKYTIKPVERYTIPPSAIFVYGNSNTRNNRQSSRKRKTPNATEVVENPITNTDEPPTYEVEKILDKQISPITKQIKYLVKWKDYDNRHNSWEPIKNLKEAQWIIDQYESEKEQETLTELKEQQESQQRAEQQIPTRLNQDYILNGELSSVI